MRGHAGFGAVVRTSEPVAHKRLGAGSSVLSSKGFSATAGTAACTDSHRQHERAEVDLFTTSTNAHFPLFFSLSHSPLKGDALTSHWPAARLYAFPTINILPLVLCKTREKGGSVILIASNWLMPAKRCFPQNASIQTAKRRCFALCGLSSVSLITSVHRKSSSRLVISRSPS